MTKRHSPIRTHFLLGLLGILVVLFIAFLLFRDQNPRQTTQTPTSGASATTTFRSSPVMDFTIEVPEGFVVEEKAGRLILSNVENKIYIDTNSTNFDNLSDYIEHSQNNLRTRLTQKKQIELNSLQSIQGYIGERKIYFIYASNQVYLLFTDSSQVFDTLDQISQSFQYTPY